MLPGRPSMCVYSWWLLTSWHSILDEPINYPQTDRVQPWVENTLPKCRKVVDK